MKSKYYLCERCGGVAVLAHHIEHITAANINNPEITLNWSNLEALCLECHNSAHGSGKATADGINFDKNGNIVYRGFINEGLPT
jgi:5-methylcytosine-specific restriction endonuclease McrA